MKPTTPNLLTLLRWADRLRRGESCAEWESWHEQADGTGQWQQIVQTQKLLELGHADPNGDLALSAEELAAWVDGTLDAPASQRMEIACWASDRQLVEAMSAVAFVCESELVEPSNKLEKRLLALGTKGQNGHATKLAGPLEFVAKATQPAVVEPAVTKAAEVTPVRERSGRNSIGWRFWPAIGVAGVVIIALSATVGWLIGSRQHTPRLPEQIAETSPNSGHKIDQPKVVTEPVLPGSQDSLAKSLESSNTPSKESERPDPPPGSLVEKAAPPAARQLPIVERPIDKIARPSPSAPATLTNDVVQGVLLVQLGGTGIWSAAPKSLVLKEPARFASLTDGWASSEIAGVGTLVWEGPVEAMIAVRPDKLIEVQLKQGRLGIEQLAADVQMRFETSGATWTVRGVAGYSTIAVIDNPLTPVLLVAKGEVAVDELRVASQQGLSWQEGVPQSISLAGGASSVNYDLAWMQPPDERLRKQWTSFFGKLATRVAEAENASQELQRLLAASRDPRQTALLTQWNLELADEVARPQQEWNLLNDRREQARLAAVKTLLDLPTGHPRLLQTEQYWRRQVGEETTARVMQWLMAARQPVPPAPPQAIELVDHLAHKDLAVRQIAASLLELKTAPLFQLIDSRPPTYDASSPASTRMAAQNEWRMMLRQLYAKYRGNPIIMPPSAIKQLSPGAAAPQNVNPGGT